MENLPLIQFENIEEGYNNFMAAEELLALNKFVQEDKLNANKLQKLTEDYIFTQKTSSKQEVIDVIENQPSIMKRSSVGEVILSNFMNFMNTFFND